MGADNPTLDRVDVGHRASSGGSNPQHLAWRWFWVLSACVLAIAAWSLPRNIQAGDAGEFATVMLTGGVPHPSGYPWMRVLGVPARWLWAIGTPPAIAAALPPALCGVAAWLLSQRSCMAIGRSPRAKWIAAFVVLFLAASPLVVIHVNDSEVWGPHLMFSALFIHTVISTRHSRTAPIWLGLTIGLAISHHLTAVWLIPLAVGAATPAWADYQSSRDWARDLVRNGMLGFASALLGLLPFATLPIGRGGAWRWGDVRTLEGLFHHITRGDYGTFSLSLHEEEVAVADTVARALGSIGEIFSAGLVDSPVFGAAVLGGALAGAIVLASSLGRGVAIGWVLSLVASGVVFPAMQNIDPTGPFGAWILERFDLLTALLMIVPLCAGLGWLGDALLERLGVRPSVLRIGAAAVAAVMLLAQVGAVLEHGRPRTEAAVELAAIDMLETPDPERLAIVFGTDDHRSFPALYAQAVLGAGAHTLYVDAQLLAHPWYRAWLRARMPNLPDEDKPLRMIGAIWSDPELANVPIYLANVFSEPSDRVAKVPEGLLWRLPPPSDHPSFVPAEWTHEAIVARHLAAFARYRITVDDFGGLTHPRGHPWSADLWHAYVDKSRLLAATLSRANRNAEAEQVLDALERCTGAR
jgi:hypothetical protein